MQNWSEWSNTVTSFILHPFLSHNKASRKCLIKKNIYIYSIVTGWWKEIQWWETLKNNNCYFSEFNSQEKMTFMLYDCIQWLFTWPRTGRNIPSSNIVSLKKYFKIVFYSLSNHQNEKEEKEKKHETNSKKCSKAWSSFIMKEAITSWYSNFSYKLPRTPWSYLHACKCSAQGGAQVTREPRKWWLVSLCWRLPGPEHMEGLHNTQQHQAVFLERKQRAASSPENSK